MNQTKRTLLERTCQTCGATHTEQIEPALYGGMPFACWVRVDMSVKVQANMMMERREAFWFCGVACARGFLEGKA